MDHPQQPEQPEPPASVRRRSLPLWPVLGVVALVTGTAFALVPSVRAQAELSLTRQPSAYVELAATPVSDTRIGTTCRRRDRGATATVVFSLTSHYRDAEEIAYEVSASEELGPTAELVSDRVRVEAGDSVTLGVDVPLPGREAVAVTVRLPATGQYLLLHCSGVA